MTGRSEIAVLLALSLLASAAKGDQPAVTDAPPNTLTESEKAAGWRLLWDGKSTDGWRSVRSETFPSKGWKIAGGMLTLDATGDGFTGGGGDIITRDRFSSFDLLIDFRVSPGANSGIKYFFQPNLDPDDHTGTGLGIGCEYQILDDLRHPDAHRGRDGNRTLGALYDLIPPAPVKQARPVGDWNIARIVVRGHHVEHWLNGQMLLAYERDSAAFRARVAESKYKKFPGFGEWPDGHILLQDHGFRVDFRNLKIHILSGSW